MKATSSLFQVVSGIILLLLILIIVNPGCKKKEEPSDPQPTIFEETIPEPLTGQNLDIRTQEEITNNVSIPAYLHAQVGQSIYYFNHPTGPVGGPIGTVVDVASLALAIYQTATTPSYSADFNKIDNELSAISNQLNQLSNQLNALMAQLLLTQVDIQTYMSSLSIQPYLVTIQSYYGETPLAGLGYYANQAATLQHGDTAAFAILKTELATQYFPLILANIPEAIQGIHDAICPSIGALRGCLLDYTNFLILNPSTNYNNQPVHDPQNKMLAYQLLETYFTTVINYQIQGLVILANYYNVQDTSGSLTRNYISTTFAPMLQQEIITYLNTVNYLTLNLFDNRNLTQYTSDMVYSRTGIATDTAFYNVLGRARFVCSLFQHSAGITPGALCGNILIPHLYGVGSTASVSNINFTYSGPSSGDTTISPILSQGFPSIYPYTAWQTSPDPKIMIASPDNNFNTFLIGIPVSKIKSGKYSIKINDNGNPQSPWRHDQPINGSVTIKYYNPRNPDPSKATTTPTDSNTMAFAFFSSRWIWGFQQMSMGDLSSITIPSQFYAFAAGGISGNPYTYLCSAEHLSPTTNSTSPPFMHTISYSQSNFPSETPFVFQYTILLKTQFESPPGVGNTFNLNFYSTLSHVFSMPPGIFNLVGSNITYTDGSNYLDPKFFEDESWIPYIPKQKSTVVEWTFIANETYLWAFTLYGSGDLIKPTSVNFNMNWTMQPMFENTYNIFN